MYRDKQDREFDANRAMVLLELDAEGENLEQLIVRQARVAMPAFLRHVGLKRFIPFKRPSIEKRPGIVEIMLYHNDDLYNTIYQHIDDGFIMMPGGPTLDRLDELYAQNGFFGGWDDEGCCTDI